MDKLVDIFCDVDDFCRVFIPEWEKYQLADGFRKRQRDSRMTIHYRDFKNYYLAQ